MKVTTIDKSLLNGLSKKAVISDRKRMNHNFHKLEDPAQRFLNAIEPGSYIRPHRHIDPIKDEAFLILRGKGAVLVFDETGNITDCTLLHQKAGSIGVDIPGGVIHSIISLEKGTIFYEVKPGPYTPASDKCFPDWAPPENSKKAASYYQVMENQVKEYLADAITIS